MTPEDLAAMIITEIQTGGKAALIPNFYEKTIDEIFEGGIMSIGYIRDNETKLVKFRYKKKDSNAWDASAEIITELGKVSLGETVVEDKHVYSLIKLIKNDIMPSAAFIEKF